ncbi:MAG: glycoside hydrolase family 13 protein [Clostridia bacterium]|nr:glycoside hydrolase family 13 protein [Clostridia bacterium]
MNTSAVRHLSFYPFVQALARSKARFFLEAAADDLTSCELVWWKRSIPEKKQAVSMTASLCNRRMDQWGAEVCFQEEAHYIKYGFRLTDRTGKTTWYNACGFHEKETPEGSFEILQINETDVLRVPAWSRGCIYYQIFPERFAKSGKVRGLIDAWNAPPTRENFLGGNLRGIIEHLPYLKDLGIECIYLNPIFLGDFNHKYATTDYFKIDPMFGTEPDLTELVEKAHRQGIRVLLDGVFNHVGIHFPPFMDLMEKGEKSPYRDWFYPKQYPIRIDPACYECVGDYPYMPRLNGANAEVRNYVQRVLLYWLEHAHIDGWRFDVADELDRHAVTMWREAVKRDYPDALILAETWGDASRLLGPDGFDSAMNYLFRDAVIDFFARGAVTADQFKNRLVGMLMRYPEEINLSMYNLLGSHDTARFLTEAGGEIWRLRLAMAFQMLFPGAPALYYGDELGMTGENDPGCRGGMAWDTPNEALHAWQKDLIALRKKHPCLRTGTFSVLAADNSLFAFQRTDQKDCVAAVFNTGETPQQLDLTEAEEPVHIPPRSVKIIERP